MFDTSDPRAGLQAAARAEPASVAELQVFELNKSEPDGGAGAGPRTWSVRGATFCVTYAALVAQDTLTWTDEQDETILVVADPNLRLTVTSPEETLVIEEPSVVILPPGEHLVSASTAGDLVRVTAVRGLEAGVRNDDFYREPRPEMDELPPVPTGTAVSRAAVHPLADVHPQEGRFGRIFRSNALMVNLLEEESGPRDPDRLSPHSHDTFEQCSVTLEGDYVHHVRVPWTPRSSEWRPDEHREVSSPSITVIPNGMIHTTGGIGEGKHLMMDVFAPPRADFLAMPGWVLNAADYPSAP